MSSHELFSFAHLIIRLASDGVLDIWIISIFGIGIFPASPSFVTMSVGICVRFRSNTHLQGFAYSRLGRRIMLTAEH